MEEIFSLVKTHNVISYIYNQTIYADRKMGENF